MGSLGVKAEFTCTVATSNTSFTFSLSQTCCCHLEQNNIYMADRAGAERKLAVDLHGEQSLWSKEVMEVEDTNLSAGREVNCAFIGWAVICHHCVSLFKKLYKKNYTRKTTGQLPSHHELLQQTELDKVTHTLLYQGLVFYYSLLAVKTCKKSAGAQLLNVTPELRLSGKGTC